MAPLGAPPVRPRAGTGRGSPPRAQEVRLQRAAAAIAYGIVHAAQPEAALGQVRQDLVRQGLIGIQALERALDVDRGGTVDQPGAAPWSGEVEALDVELEQRGGAVNSPAANMVK